jgi:hypothetical protein
VSEEGELKKRIHKAYGELDDGICHEECLPNIDEVLGVMWQEFPKKKLAGSVLDKKGKTCKEIWMYDKMEVDEWFLRWKGKQ